MASLGVAASAARDAAANAFARRSPQFALRLDAEHGRALSVALDRKLVGTGGGKQLAAPEIAAIRSSLRQAPLNAPLLRLLGVSRSLAGDERGARALVVLADKTARRDFFTQMWLIEDAVGRNDIREALSHYDVALTTSRSGGVVLFPILTSALDIPEIRSVLREYIVSNRPWSTSFLNFAISNGRPSDVAALLQGVLEKRQDDASQIMQADLLGHFFSAGDLTGARNYAASLAGLRDPQRQAFGFSAKSADPKFTPLTWRLTNDADISAEVGGGDGLEVTVASGAKGLAARRVMFLSPGRKDFVEVVEFAPGGVPADASWQWSCLEGKSARPFATQDIPTRAGSNTYRLVIDVPACEAVALDLTVLGGDGQTAAAITIKEIRLEPSGQASGPGTGPKG